MDTLRLYVFRKAGMRQTSMLRDLYIVEAPNDKSAELYAFRLTGGLCWYGGAMTVIVGSRLDNLPWYQCRSETASLELLRKHGFFPWSERIANDTYVSVDAPSYWRALARGNG